MRILGFDPSSSVTGWAVLDFANWQEPPILAGYGKFSIHRDLSITEKLRAVQAESREVLDKYCPDQTAYEEAYVKFIKAAMPLYRVHGALILAIDEFNRDHGLGVEPLNVNVNTARKQLGITDKESARTLVNKTFSKEFTQADYDITDAIIIAWYAHVRAVTGERKKTRRKK